MLTERIRRISINALDGIKFNKDKLAQDAIVLCDLYDRLHAAHSALNTKVAQVEAELGQLKSRRSSASKAPDFPPGFADIFNGFADKK